MMIADQEILNLPNLSLKMKDSLPEFSGIYYIVDENHIVWYIGKAQNIRKRWQGKAHHRIYQLESQKKHHFYIYYEQVDLLQLDNIEKQRIQKYDPHLNHSPVKTKKVRPVETLLRETIATISDFAFILGIETPTQEVKLTNNINNTLRCRKNPQSEIIHIGFDFHLMKNKFNSTSQEEEEAIIKSIFQSRKTYSKKWEVIPKKYPLLYRLYVNNYIVEYSCLLNSFILQKSEDYFEYLDTTFAQESIKCL